MIARIWDERLTQDERELLLHAAYPSRSMGFASYEAKLKWSKLMPSTQLMLRDVDWSMVLYRKVKPD